MKSAATIFGAFCWALTFAALVFANTTRWEKGGEYFNCVTMTSTGPASFFSKTDTDTVQTYAGVLVGKLAILNNTSSEITMILETSNWPLPSALETITIPAFKWRNVVGHNIKGYTLVVCPDCSASDKVYMVAED